MSVLKYDRVILTKEFGKMKMVGQVYEVANITETSFILRDVRKKIAVGVIEIKDFNDYFKKAEEVRGWTPWTTVGGFEQNEIFYYRTNYKKVQVRTIEGYRAEASCNVMDEFNLYFGIKLAYLRCKDKYLKDRRFEYNDVFKKMTDDYNKAIEAINYDIKNNESFMDTMIKSLNEKVEKR